MCSMRFTAKGFRFVVCLLIGCLSIFKVGFIVLCFLFSFVGLADIQVKSFVRPQALSPKDMLTLTLEIEYDTKASIGSPRLPGLSAFHLLGQNESSHFQSVNGAVSRKKQYHYRLKPLKEGVFKIGSIEVVVEGKLYKTDPLIVKVSSKIKPSPPASGPAFPFGGFKKFFSPFFDEGEQDSSVFNNPVNEKDIFFKLALSDDKVYLNQMILAKWFFYKPFGRVIFAQNEVTKKPNLNGFWVEEIISPSIPAPLKESVEEVRGKKYKKQVVISSALFPVRVGELKVGALEIKTRLISSRPFAQMFSQAHRVFLKHSKMRKVTVLPLPEEGKGPAFTGAVGDFNITAEVGKKAVAVNEPIVYKLRFKGKGHPRTIRLPDLKFGDSWKVYDTTESQKFSVSESVKNFEVILIPKSSGEHIIPSFELSSFDPEIGVYKTHILPAFKVKAVGVSVPGRSQTARYFDVKEKKSAGSKADKDQSQKTFFIPWQMDSEKSLWREYGKYFWFVLFGLLFFAFIGIEILSFRKKRSPLKELLRKSFLQVDQSIKAGRWKQAGVEMDRIMYSFFAELLSQDKDVKNWNLLLRDIDPSIRARYETKIKALIFRLERLSFASSETAKELRNKKHVEALKNEIVDLLNKISKEYTNS